MLTRNQVIAFLTTLALLAVGVGLFVSYQEGLYPITMTVDGVRFVKTADAGWQPMKPGDYSTTLTGALVSAYGRPLAQPQPPQEVTASPTPRPSELPHTSAPRDEGCPLLDEQGQPVMGDYGAVLIDCEQAQ